MASDFNEGETRMVDVTKFFKDDFLGDVVSTRINEGVGVKSGKEISMYVCVDLFNGHTYYEIFIGDGEEPVSKLYNLESALVTFRYAIKDH